MRSPIICKIYTREVVAVVLVQKLNAALCFGTYALSAGYYDAYYKKAQAVRTLIIQDFEKAFKEVDIILTPTCPHPALKLGAQNDDPLAMYLKIFNQVFGWLTGNVNSSR